LFTIFNLHFIGDFAEHIFTILPQCDGRGGRWVKELISVKYLKAANVSMYSANKVE
jgi:hypothetical protein